MPDTQTVVFSKVITLTDAQIKSLPTTPIQLIEAPGAGKVIVGVSGLISVASQAGAYTNIGYADGGGNGVLDLIIGNNTNFILSFPPMALVYAALNGASPLTKIPLVQHHSNYISSDEEVIKGRVQAGYSKGINVNQFLENQAVSISVWNSINDNDDAGDFTGGDAANYMRINISYTVIDL